MKGRKLIKQLRKRTIRGLFKFIIWILNIFTSERIVVIGDSHVNVFSHIAMKLHFPLINFDVCSVKGATASGLANPNSKTQALNIFKQKLETNFSKDKVIFLLGEVDVGFVIWYRSDKYNVTVDEMLCRAVNSYAKLLIESKKFTKSIIVISAPLPTIGDYNTLGKVVNLRRKVKANQKERTILTIKFNEMVEQVCIINGIQYINIDNDSIGSDGLVNKRILNKTQGNHHYDPFVYSALLKSELKKLL